MMEQEIIPEISIIMGVYNPGNYRYLEASVQSILNQTFKNFEFIIYDDGSHAEAAQIIKKLQLKDKRIRIMRCDTNHGLAFSLNQCIDVAKGKYLARMDDDDISFPQRLEREYAFLETHPEYDWVGCNALILSDSEIVGIRKMAEIPNQYNFLPFSPYVHPSVMFRRELFEQGNKYNISQETLRCEDYELFMKLYQQGYIGYNIQECLFVYRENLASYHRRTVKSRWCEMKIRRNNFCKIGLPRGRRMLYILRPLFTVLIPRTVIIQYKKIRLRRLNPIQKWEIEQYRQLFEDTVKEGKEHEWQRSEKTTAKI